jgi:hypothetical protein
MDAVASRKGDSQHRQGGRQGCLFDPAAEGRPHPECTADHGELPGHEDESQPAVGGTAEGWTANVVKTFTLNEAYTFLDAGEWLVGQYNEVNAGNPVGASIVVHYKMGR